jgi:integrase
MAAKKLSARLVETVSTKLDREDFRDVTARGLQLRVTKGGAKTWTFRYRRKSDGKLRRVTLGAFPGVGLDDARQLAKELSAAVGRGADPAGEAQQRKQAETFGEIAEDWLERHAKPNKAVRTVQDDQSMLARHVLPAIGAMKAGEVTKRDIIRLLDDVAASPDARIKVKRRSADQRGSGPRKMTHRPNRVFELVRAIFRWAVGRDLLKVDPTWGMPPPIKKEKARERELSPDEIRKLWSALERAPIKRRTTKGLARGERVVEADDIPMTRATALTLMLALATGQRIGEVTGIAVAELDLNDIAPVWTVPGDRVKNGQANRVPLSPLAVRLIQGARALAPEARWLFPAADGAGPIDPHAPTKALERARQAIGLEDFRIHDLRRTAATRMAEMGIAPHTISLVLNHVSARQGNITGKVYVQYSYDREKRDALGAWGQRLEAIFEGNSSSNLVIAIFGNPTDAIVR